MRRRLGRYAVSAVFFFVLSGIFVACAQSEEKILSFHSDIDVHADATMTVTETIIVNSLGQKIRRGIYRDFPTRYKDRYGNHYVVGFEIVSIQRDGHTEPHRIAGQSNGKRVYIGEEKVFIPSGRHTYEITYTTNRQLGFFADHDELYWNVTGNGWEFPIDQASATVRLPDGAGTQVLQTDGYTGPQGSRENAVTISTDSWGRQSFATTRRLRPYEGLTIFVSWPKGYVTQPDAWTRWGYFWRDNRSLIYAVAGLAGILAYFLVAWYLFGKDPKKGVIIPLFNPPEGFSPAIARYVEKMGYDNKAFTAAVLSMAVKGFWKIEETPGVPLLGLDLGKSYSLRKTGGDTSRLSPEEAVLAEKLLWGSNMIEMKNTYHERFSKAISAVKESLSRQTEAVYFFSNSGYMIIGFLLLLVWGFFDYIALESGDISMPAMIVLGVLAAGLYFLFNHLLKAPTLKGRKKLDQLEGFKMYLSVAEKDRMNMLNPPERTPELFEKYLPYALALDVEQKWAEQFTDVFARLSKEGREYAPGWYYGGSWRGFNAGRFSSSLSSSLSGVIAAAAVAPGSSSGGGGFSGGGGGGGGGGGW